MVNKKRDNRCLQQQQNTSKEASRCGIAKKITIIR